MRTSRRVRQTMMQILWSLLSMRERRNPFGDVILRFQQSSLRTEEWDRLTANQSSLQLRNHPQTATLPRMYAQTKFFQLLLSWIRYPRIHHELKLLLSWLPQFSGQTYRRQDRQVMGNLEASIMLVNKASSPAHRQDLVSKSPGVPCLRHAPAAR